MILRDHDTSSLSHQMVMMSSVMSHEHRGIFVGIFWFKKKTNAARFVSSNPLRVIQAAGLKLIRNMSELLVGTISGTPSGSPRVRVERFSHCHGNFPAGKLYIQNGGTWYHQGSSLYAHTTKYKPVRIC